MTSCQVKMVIFVRWGGVVGHFGPKRFFLVTFPIFSDNGLCALKVISDQKWRILVKMTDFSPQDCRYLSERSQFPGENRYFLTKTIPWWSF